MIKQSSLLRWTHNTSRAASKNKNWIHPPEALQGGHVAYLVKYLGCTEVDKPKGIEVVKEGIRKLKFNQYLKKSEGSTAKIPKVELTISIDGVAIQDPKTRIITYQYPLHRISYCADDKSDKKFFSFIAKEPDDQEKHHRCFVFISDKLAEEITLTIGQAFDLAYRRFLDTSGRDLEMRKHIMVLQKKVKELESENKELKQKLAECSKNEDSLKRKNVASPPVLVQNGNLGALTAITNKTQHNGGGPIPLLQPPPPSGHHHRHHNNTANNNNNVTQDLLGSITPIVQKKIDNDDFLSDENFDPRSSNGHRDLFGAEPFNPQQNDPFEMGDFVNSTSDMDLDNAIGAIDKKLSEMRAGFSQGLTFGNEDFALETSPPGS